MTRDIFDLLLPPEDTDLERISGVVTAIVTNNKDEKGLGRVKVKFPWLSESDESYWARVAAPMAGPDRGACYLPQVDDEVLVAFDQGVIDHPYVLGALWNTNRMPPEKTEDAQNKYTLRSRSGLLIRLDDSKGGEKIEISDKEEKNTIVIDVANNTITINADADISIEARDGKLSLSGKGISITSQAEVKIEAGSTMDLTSSSAMKLKGATIDLN